MRGNEKTVTDFRGRFRCEIIGLVVEVLICGWHSRLKNPSLTPLRIFRVPGFTKILVLYRRAEIPIPCESAAG
jgi:hypothetical protein